MHRIRVVALIALLGAIGCSSGNKAASTGSTAGATTAAGTTSTGTSSGASTGTTSHALAGLCQACAADTDCRSGFCDPGNHRCNTSQPCDQSPGACESAGLTCSAAIGACLCPGAATTSSSGGTASTTTSTTSTGTTSSTSSTASTSTTGTTGTASTSTTGTNGTSSTDTTGGATGSSTGGTTGGGIVPLCGTCSVSSDCQSGYCDRSTHTCNVASPCSSDAQCSGLSCDTGSGNCLCPGVTTSTSTSSTASSGSTGGTSSSGTTGGGSTGTSSSSSSGTTGSFTAGLSVVSGDNQTVLLDQAESPVTISLKDGAGAGIAGAAIVVSAASGAAANPAAGNTDSNGRFTFTPFVGRAPHAYAFTVSTPDGGAGDITLTGNAVEPDAGTIFTLVNLNHSAGNTPNPAPGTQALVGAVRGFRQASDKSIYFADSTYAVVRKLSPDGELTVVAGIPNSAGFSGDNGPAIAAQLNNPYDVELDEPNGVLYIADVSNSRIRAVDLVTGLITTVAGGNTSAPNPGYGDSGVGTSANVQAYTLALAPNHLLVFPDIVSQRIRSLNTQTLIVNNWLSQPTFPPSECYTGSLSIAFHSVNSADAQVIFDAAGNAYVSANWGGSAVGAPTRKCSYDSGAVAAVVQIAPGGATRALVGSSGSQFTEGTWSASYNFSGNPRMAVDPAGNLYLSEPNRHRIVWMDAGSGQVRTFSGTSGAGYAGDYVPYAPNVQYTGPGHIAFDPDGNLLVADSGNYALRVLWKVARTAKLISSLTITGGNNASAVVDQAGVQMKVKLADSDGNPLVGYKIQYSVTDPGGGIYATSSVTDAAGVAKVLNNAGLAVGPYHFQAAFNDPYGNPVQNSPVTFTLNATATAVGNIFTAVNVAHSSGNTPVPPAVAGHAPNNAVMANVGAVRGFRQASNGSIYFADPTYAAVRKLSPEGELTVVAGIPGSGGFSGDNGLAIAAQLNNPYDVELDEPNGVLYIADVSNSRIRAVDLVSGIITTVAGGNTSAPNPGYGDSGPGTSANVQAYTLALGPNNLLVFPDIVSQRIRSLNTQTLIVNNWLSQPTFPPNECYTGSLSLVFHSVNSADAQVIFDAAGNAYISANWAGSLVHAPTRKCSYDTGAVQAVVTGGTAVVGSAQSWNCGNGVTCNGSFDPGTPAGSFYFSGNPRMALDANGVLYVSEFNRHRVMYKDASGNMQLAVGDGSPGYAGDYVPFDGSAGSVQLNGPGHIGFTAPNNRLTISDTGNYALRMVWR